MYDFIGSFVFSFALLLEPLFLDNSVGTSTTILGVQQTIPESEEWLCKVGLDAPVLVVDVVVGSVVARDDLKRVPRERVATVVVHSLDSRQGEEDSALAHRHQAGLEGKASTNRIKQEPLERVVVQGAVGIRNIEAVMARVEGS